MQLEQLPKLSKLWSASKFWLLGIGAGLMFIHLTLVLHSGQNEMFSTSVLYWLAIASLVWRKRDGLKLSSGLIGTAPGLLLIAIVLIKSQSLSSIDVFLRVMPLISAIGLGLLASGVKQLRQYWQEFVVLCFMVPHSGVLSQVLDVAKPTAEVSTMLLWCFGFDVSRQGVYVMLPTGSVEVNPGCAGYGSIWQMLSLAVIFLFMFSTNWFQKILVPLVALFLGFAVNSIRVAIMAVLSASGDRAGFSYWHSGDGSLVFSFIAVLLFGLFCYFIIQEPIEDEPEPSSET